MILVSRSGRNPTVYIPNVQPPHQPLSSYFLALDILGASQARRAKESGMVQFLGAHPQYQEVCGCGHRQLAHEDGMGPCLAKKCGCPRFTTSRAA